MANTLSKGGSRTGPAGTLKQEAENAAVVANKADAVAVAEAATLVAHEGEVLYRVIKGWPVFNCYVGNTRVVFDGGHFVTGDPTIIRGLQYHVDQRNIAIVDDKRAE